MFTKSFLYGPFIFFAFNLTSVLLGDIVSIEYFKSSTLTCSEVVGFSLKDCSVPVYTLPSG